jgi:hypothetical protein
LGHNRGHFALNTLSLFGLAAVSAMLLLYSLEKRSHWFILAFASAWLRPSALSNRQITIGGERMAQSLSEGEHPIRGAVYYPPCAVAARLLAPFDFRIGQKTTFGSAFLALKAVNPSGSPGLETV